MPDFLLGLANALGRRADCANSRVLILFRRCNTGGVSHSKHNRLIIRRCSAQGGEVFVEKIVKSDQQWQELLSKEEFQVCRQKGTERAFSGEYNGEKAEGVYTCRCCGLALFRSDTKYDSGSGWPSFYQPADGEVVAVNRDVTHGMVREEVVCARCDAHLGHVFPDGPAPTGLRYCINSLSLKLDKESAG